MADEKVIATLVGDIKFKTNFDELDKFENKMDAIASKFQSLQTSMRNGIVAHIAINRPKFASDIRGIEARKIVFRDIKFDATAALAALGAKLSTTSLKVSALSIPRAALLSELGAIRAFFANKTIAMRVDLDTSGSVAKIDQLVSTLSRRKIVIHASFSKLQLFQSLRKALSGISARVHRLKIEADLKLRVDPHTIRTEIARAIAILERVFWLRVRFLWPNDPNPPGGGGGRGGGSGRNYTPSAGGFVPGIGLGWSILGANKIGQEMQGQTLALETVMKSEEGGAQQEAWFADIANRLGLHKRATMPAYTKMLATGLTSGYKIEDVQNTFVGMASYGRVLGLDSETMKGSMRAIEQMMNKGQIMAEELKNQLAERAPGVLSAMAEAAKLDPEDEESVSKLFKMMEKGELKSKQYMDKFTDILFQRAMKGGALEKAMKLTSAVQGRFMTAWDDSLKRFSEGGFDEAVRDKMAIMTDSMRSNAEGASAMGEAFKILTKPVDAFLLLMGKAGGMLPSVAQSFGTTQGKVLAAGGAIAGLIFPWTRFITLAGAAVTAIHDFTNYLEGNDSVFGRWRSGLSGESQTAVDNIIANFGRFGEAVSKIFSDVKLGWELLFKSIGGEGSVLALLDKTTALLVRAAEAVASIRGTVSKEIGDFTQQMGDFSLSKELNDTFGWMFVGGAPTALERSMQQSEYALNAARMQLPGYTNADLIRAVGAEGEMSRLAQEQSQQSAFSASVVGAIKAGVHDAVAGSVLGEKVYGEKYNPSATPPVTIENMSVTLPSVTDAAGFEQKIQSIAKRTLQDTIQQTVGVMAPGRNW